MRHTEVARAWKTRCYGRTDVPLSRSGQAAIAPLAIVLRNWCPDRIIHSGLKRTQRLADHLGLDTVADPKWQERDFGNWEGQSWAAIYRKTGNAMDGMIESPDDFRPGGGETTRALQKRVVRAFNILPKAGRTIIITHGGPIAALIGSQKNLHPRQWLAHLPGYGGMVCLDDDHASSNSSLDLGLTKVDFSISTNE